MRQLQELLGPYASAQYKDKSTLFAWGRYGRQHKMMTVVINPRDKECKVRLPWSISDCKVDDANDKLHEGLQTDSSSVIDDYSYLTAK